MQKAFLRLTPGQAKNAQGLILFRLALWVGTQEIDKVTAVSGQPGLQELVKAADREPSSGRPIGEGVYLLGDPDAVNRVNWAHRVGEFTGSFGRGLGPVWVGIHAPAGNPLGIRTHDYGIHQDDNQSSNPGTLGCVGIQGQKGDADYTRLSQVVAWFQQYDVQKLVVDYGLGTVYKPGAKPIS